jgi:hypothetical protein
MYADATEGNYFAGWGGACSGAARECRVVIDGDANVSAAFSPYQFALTIETSGGGRVLISYAGECRGSCTMVYGFGAYVTLTAEADAGSALSGWDGPCSGSGTTCTVGMFGDTTVRTTFSP